MKIFLDDTDYRWFVFLLGEVVEEFELECWNYCLMPNHYHTTLNPTRPNLSEAMRRLNGEYAQWWNKRHDRVGHVFQGRFKDQIVQREGYLLTLSRYVARNPVRADLVERPEHWEWSSFGALIGKRAAPAFVSVESTLSLFGDGDAVHLQCRFAEYVSSDAEDQSVVDRIRSSEQIVGDRPFKLAVNGQRPGAPKESSLTPAKVLPDAAGMLQTA